jgi:hypothetical protein
MLQDAAVSIRTVEHFNARLEVPPFSAKARRKRDRS